METGKVNGVCPICGAEKVFIDKATGRLVEDGQTVAEYETRTCECLGCGSPVYNREVDEFNRLAVANAIRETYGGMSLKAIKRLPLKYGISRKEFCVVMGVPKTTKYGDDTVPFKLFDGDLPGENLEKRLLAIEEDPKKWIEFLDLAKKKIPKEAYDKSMEKAKELLK